MERVKGIEPSSQAWEARILPLNHTRVVALTNYLAEEEMRRKRKSVRSGGAWILNFVVYFCPRYPLNTYHL